MAHMLALAMMCCLTLHCDNMQFPFAWGVGGAAAEVHCCGGVPAGCEGVYFEVVPGALWPPASQCCQQQDAPVWIVQVLKT